MLWLSGLSFSISWRPRGLSVPGVEPKASELVLAEEVTLSVQEAMQGHLMPYATKSEDGDHVTGPRVDFRWLERVLEIGRRSSLDTRSRLAQVRAGNVARERRGATGWNYSTVKSPQRLSATLSIRPRGRVQIIDM